MKVTFEDDDGKQYEAEYEDGTSRDTILKDARAELGKPVHIVNEKKSSGIDSVVFDATNREIARAESALHREIKKSEGLRETITKLNNDLSEAKRQHAKKAEALTDSISQLKKEIAEYKRRHSDASSSKIDVSISEQMSVAKLYACERQLERERTESDLRSAKIQQLESEIKSLSAEKAARLKAEEQCRMLTQELAKRDNVPSFRGTIVTRDGNDFTKEWIIEPIYAKADLH